MQARTEPASPSAVPFADLVVSFVAALSVPLQRARLQAANPTRGAGTGASALWLPGPAYPAAAAGMQVNHKRIYCLDRAAGLMVKRRRRPPRCCRRARAAEPAERAEQGVVDGLGLRCT